MGGGDFIHWGGLRFGDCDIEKVGCRVEHCGGSFAGSMTDPPALTFANAIKKSDSPSVAYATMYPLRILLRIIVAQTRVLLLAQ